MFFILLDESLVKMMTSSRSSSCRRRTSSSLVNSVAKLMDAAGSVATASPADSPYSTASSRTLSNTSCCSQSEDPLVSMEATAADRELAAAAASAADILNATDIVSDQAPLISHDEPLNMMCVGGAGDGMCVETDKDCGKSGEAVSPLQLFTSNTSSPSHIVNMKEVRITPTMPHSNANFAHDNQMSCATLTNAPLSDCRKRGVVPSNSTSTLFSPNVKRLRILYRTAPSGASPPLLTSRSCTLASSAVANGDTDSPVITYKPTSDAPHSPIITIHPHSLSALPTSVSDNRNAVSPPPPLLHNHHDDGHDPHADDMDTNIANLSKFFAVDGSASDQHEALREVCQSDEDDTNDLVCVQPTTTQAPVVTVRDVTRDFVTHSLNNNVLQGQRRNGDTKSSSHSVIDLRSETAAHSRMESKSRQKDETTVTLTVNTTTTAPPTKTTTSSGFERQKSPLISLKLPVICASSLNTSRPQCTPSSSVVRALTMTGRECRDDVTTPEWHPIPRTSDDNAIFASDLESDSGSIITT